MNRHVSQIIDNKEESGDGTITVIATDDNGKQYASTECYYKHLCTSREDAIEKATQDSLDKS